MIERFADCFPVFRVDPRTRRHGSRAATFEPWHPCTWSLDRPHSGATVEASIHPAPRGPSRRPAARQTGAHHMAKTAPQPVTSGETGTPQRTSPVHGSTAMRTPRPRTSCRSMASTTSSSGSATPARRPRTSARCGDSRRSRSRGSRRCPGPRQLRDAAARHPDRADGAAHSRRRDRRARPRPRRRRAGHRVRGRDSAAAWRETTARGARSAMEPVELDGGEDGILRRSAVWTYGEVRHSFVDRRDYHGVFAPGYRRVKKPAAAATGSACSRSTTAWATSGSAT